MSLALSAVSEKWKSEFLAMVRAEHPPSHAALIEKIRSAPDDLCFHSACFGHSLYQLWSAEHINHIAAFINERFPGKRIIEVCAGDGRLTRYLIAAGVPMLQATDTLEADKSECDFKQQDYGQDVRKIEAVAAAIEAQANLVVVSWPPYGSDVVDRLLAAGFSVLFIGEGDGGCCGNDATWNNEHEHIDCGEFQLCRTDFVFDNYTAFNHSRTVLFPAPNRGT
jgi:hypothetical protein